MGRKSQPINLVWHFPEGEEAKKQCIKRIKINNAKIYAQQVEKYIKDNNIPKDVASIVMDEILANYL